MCIGDAGVVVNAAQNQQTTFCVRMTKTDLLLLRRLRPSSPTHKHKSGIEH